MAFRVYLKSGRVLEVKGSMVDNNANTAWIRTGASTPQAIFSLSAVEAIIPSDWVTELEKAQDPDPKAI